MCPPSSSAAPRAARPVILAGVSATRVLQPARPHTRPLFLSVVFAPVCPSKPLQTPTLLLHGHALQTQRRHACSVSPPSMQAHPHSAHELHVCGRRHDALWQVAIIGNIGCNSCKHAALSGYKNTCVFLLYNCLALLGCVAVPISHALQVDPMHTFIPGLAAAHGTWPGQTAYAHAALCDR